LVPLYLAVSLMLTSTPALASLANNTRQFATGFFTQVLISVCLLGIIVGCATWALSSNDNGKEWAKKAVMACVIGLSAPSLIGVLETTFRS
jgi:hypothetical protein